MSLLRWIEIAILAASVFGTIGALLTRAGGIASFRRPRTWAPLFASLTLGIVGLWAAWQLELEQLGSLSAVPHLLLLIMAAGAVPAMALLLGGSWLALRREAARFDVQAGELAAELRDHTARLANLPPSEKRAALGAEFDRIQSLITQVGGRSRAAMDLLAVLENARARLRLEEGSRAATGA